MNHKRRKTRRSVRCRLCTPHRWRGNSVERFDFKTRRGLVPGKMDGSGTKDG